MHNDEMGYDVRAKGKEKGKRCKTEGEKNKKNFVDNHVAKRPSAPKVTQKVI